ncbi:MAG: preprotein translocase subunit SecG [Phenylobacterium sp.]|jgi:preprotein translocase subunit SecG|uniref:preprotein translocase subunit SecG n=1 Tax=Phenylobacterium sp. TaxID=1871053 RepID=UPI0025E78AC4|nr:preprotein translocase subunit SecG [Phenylobacterium sp.]MCA6296121.1 preprotein translocase subunit SecG [Phenylobacterium sp.]MCA6299694.1 preprotein translocase subunit SecG [Phenylobacterium sp.]
MLGLLLTLQIIVGIALTVVVLIQRSEGGALGMGGGPTGFMTARGAGDLLTRLTWGLGTAFFILSLALTFVIGRERADTSVVDRVKVESLSPEALKQQQQQQAPPPAAAPAPFEAPRPSLADPFAGAPAPSPGQPPASQTAPAPAPSGGN